METIEKRQPRPAARLQRPGRSRAPCSRSTARCASWPSSPKADGLSLSEIADAVAALRLDRLPHADDAGRTTAWSSSTGTDQLWSIGVETYRMGAAFLRRRKLVDRARIVMQELMENTGETANLGVAEDDCVVFVSQVETHQAIRAFFRPGTRSPFHASGIGKAILAHLDAGARRRHPAQGRAASLHRQDAVRLSALAADLATIKRARLVGRRRGAPPRHALRRRRHLQRIRRADRRRFGSGPTVRVTPDRLRASARWCATRQPRSPG